jgi:tetratricopeptide (TPR) repeat protein
MAEVGLALLLITIAVGALLSEREQAAAKEAAAAKKALEEKVAAAQRAARAAQLRREAPKRVIELQPLLDRAAELDAKQQYEAASVAVENLDRELSPFAELDPVPAAMEEMVSRAKQLKARMTEHAAAQDSDKAGWAKLQEGDSKAAQREFIAADGLYGEALARFRSVPAAWLKATNAEKGLRTAGRKRAGIASRVKSQKAREEKEQAAALARKIVCGDEPAISPWDGMPYAAKDYLKKNLNDPDFDVLECTRPVLTDKHCWLVACRIRGKNAFGAKVVNVMRFGIGRTQIELLR